MKSKTLIGGIAAAGIIFWIGILWMKKVKYSAISNLSTPAETDTSLDIQKEFVDWIQSNPKIQNKVMAGREWGVELIPKMEASDARQWFNFIKDMSASGQGDDYARNNLSAFIFLKRFTEKYSNLFGANIMAIPKHAPIAQPILAIVK